MKKLIIVCEEKLRKYGDFLAQLVSLDDDKENEIVGVKDGTVAAQVWTEKEYEANAVQISSEQYILFIGNSKLMKEKRTHMLIKYKEYGMIYGWLGKQAALCVDEELDYERYEKFIDYAQKYKPDIKKLISKKEIESKELELDAIIDEKYDSNDEGAVKIGLKKGKNAIIKITASIAKKAEEVKVKGENSIKLMSNNKRIEEQQYSCVILLFYLNDLSLFLGM